MLPVPHHKLKGLNCHRRALAPRPTTTPHLMSNLEAQMNGQPLQLQSPLTISITTQIKSLHLRMKSFHLVATPLTKLPSTQGNKTLAHLPGRLRPSPKSEKKYQTQMKTRQKVLIRRLSPTLRYWRAQ
ncbi:hypothetical protein PGT21_001004 [Puccinia graminis f. sp. tritici]|uniref:Uncharacterized protein n=1 Tax=Puccinia graminis f. sp. tritici TaxID=56615 RepID=A0A5B0PT57_PUCGR|nr:hypothetical protein PGT21_001004 [Puccinia graminis f. sp. tritici]